ncbi:T9SS type A sorting domain-containing protein [Hymenobacter sp. BT664]|uniref:T9SS type A sorting domain-containing protein n=1 Tax=Hymenobacter montanus TaxID=2771359 RepID=A0A927BF35_9BACT|nr:T9SS type A sorting domain-containing protein [Hymenobacter montanus]MBD2769687.1 T9SS type A sorting domain-containing protein [Hymenobacter montanus]
MEKTHLLSHFFDRKNLALLALLGLGAFAAHGQALNYSPTAVTSTAGAYNPLNNTSTAIVVSDPDDANSAPQAIGFTFNYNGQSFTQFVLNTNGALKLGSTPPSSILADFVSSTNAADNNMLFPLFTDLAGASPATSFRFQTTGTAPNRVCTVEWSGIRDLESQQFTNASFQVKLYETTNAIEFVYGPFTPSTGTASTGISGVGLKGSGTAVGRVVFGVKSAATAWSAATWQGGLQPFQYDKTSLPTAGRTFRFTATLLGTSAALERAVSVYPNPSSGVFSVDVRGANASNGLQVEVTNLLGQRVHTATVRDNMNNKLDLSHLADGVYSLKVQNGNEFSIRQVSVER